MKEKLAALYELQRQDSALSRLQKDYAAVDKGIAEKEKFEKAKAAHEIVNDTLHKTTADLHDTELEQKSVETKRADFEKKLYSGSVRNPKELQAMQDEVTMLAKMRGTLDEKILLLMDQIEVLKVSESETRAIKDTAMSAYREKHEAYKLKSDRLVVEAKKMVNKRKKTAALIDQPLLKKYEILKSTKQGVGIAALEDANACGGCKTAIPSNLLRQIKESENVQFCMNCGRIVCDLGKR